VSAISGLGAFIAIHSGTSRQPFLIVSSAKFSAASEIAFRQKFACKARTGTARAIRIA
jgi:hypothetical protein